MSMETAASVRIRALVTVLTEIRKLTVQPNITTLVDEVLAIDGARWAAIAEEENRRCQR